MRLRGKILALIGLLLLTVANLPTSVPGATPCSNAVVRSGYGLLSFLVPSVAACPGPEFTLSARPSSLTINPGSSATSTIVLNSLFNFNGTVSLSTSPPPACPSPGCSSWSVSTVSVTLGPNGTAASSLTIVAGTSWPGPGRSANVTVYGTSGTMTRSAVVTFTTPASPDFTISANPPSQTAQPGASATYKIVLTSINGFSGDVNVETPLAPCLTYCWLVNPIGVHLVAGGTNSSTLTITTTTGIKPGNYSLPVVGSGGGLSHQVTVYFTVPVPTSPDFAMSANPVSQTVQPGGTITSAIILTSIGGFSGTVILGGPLVACFSYCWSINPGDVNIPAGGTNSSTLTITTQTTIKPGNYSVTIGGGSGNLSHGVTVYFTVPSPTGPDFAISASNQTPIIQQGSSETSTLTVSSIGGFQGPVNFVASINGNGTSRPTVTVSPASLNLASGGTATSTLTVSASTSTPAGTYSLVVTATSGLISHTIVVTVTVLDPPSSSGASGGGGGGRRGLLV